MILQTSSKRSGIIRSAILALPLLVLYAADSRAQIPSLPAPAAETYTSAYDSTLSYSDSIIYFFNTNIIPKADTEPVPPLLFRIKLPPGLLSTYTSGFDAFGFQYPEKQMVYIYLDRDGSTSNRSRRVTREKDIESLLLDDLSLLNDRDELNIDKNPFRQDRTTWIIKRGKATILLYNIRKEDMARFRNYTTSFTFLRS